MNMGEIEIYNKKNYFQERIISSSTAAIAS